MSTEVAPQGQLVVPARYRNQKVETLGTGISSGFPIIRIKGKEWSLSMGKDEEYDIEGRSIDVVILRDPAINSRTYYPGGYQGAASKGKRPTCWSMDGKRPDSDVEEPESPVCDTCPKNRTHTNDQGMKVRDCANGRRLAVLPWPEWTTALLGKPLVRPCLLRVPGASLNALKAYGEDLGRMGFPYFALRTTISFEKKSEFPKLVFEKGVVLDDASLDIIDELRALSDISYITGEKTTGSMRTVNEEPEEPQEVKAPAPKPAAVSLAQAYAASKAEAATEVKEGEILPPEKPKKAPPKVKVTHNGKAPEPKPAEAAPQEEPKNAEPAAESVDDDEALRNEVLNLLGK